MAQSTLEEKGRPLIHPASGDIEEIMEFHHRFLDVARTYPVGLELGRDLASLAALEPAGPLLDRLTALRRQMAVELGLVVPGVRISDGSNLGPRQYLILVNGVRAGGGEVQPDRLLALEPEGGAADLKGDNAIDPIYGAPARWIAADQRDAALQAGCSLYDPATVIIIHLAEVVRFHASDLLGRQEVRYLLSFLQRSHPDLVGEFLGDKPALSVGEVKMVLQSLLSEGVPIRNSVRILETLADAGRSTQDFGFLVECARLSLSRDICQRAMDADGLIHALVLSPEVEAACMAALENVGKTLIPMDPATGARLLSGLARTLQRVSASGRRPHLVVGPQLRFFLRRLTENMFPQLSILSWSEVMPVRPPRPVVSILDTVRLAPA